MASPVHSGFYGKLPCRGDFMQRRVPQVFVDVWDAWLQESLQASRQQLGSQWLDIYLTSPVWRFVLAGGICGEAGYAGVMLPSVDRVGRYFPLVLVVPLEVGSCLLEAACGAGRAWFDAAEHLARRALEANDLDLEAFDAQVESLTALVDPQALAQSTELMEHIARCSFPGSAAAWHISMLGESPQRVANAMLSIELQRALRPCALWWTQGSERLEPGWLLTSGLPTPERFVAMLSGQWRAAGWASVDLAPPVVQPDATRSQAPEPEPPRPLEVKIAAVHPALKHSSGAAAEPRFVRRPEIGLWGVIAVEGGDAGARADLISDVIHDLAPQATLTAQVERARRALQSALGSRSEGAWGAQASVAVALLLVQGTECALLTSGGVRAVRGRQGTVVELGGDEPVTPAAADPGPGLNAAEVASAAGPAEDRGLLELLAAPASAPPRVGVRYEHLDPDDLWLLGAAAAMSPGLVGELSKSWASEVSRAAPARGLEETLQALLARHLPSAGLAQPVPLMVLATRIIDPTVP